MLSDDPQLEEVRGWYIDGRRVHNPFASDATLVARFDAWLAEYVAAVRADQIEKDAQVAERATRIAHDKAEIRGFEQATSLIATALRAYLIEGNTDE